MKGLLLFAAACALGAHAQHVTPYEGHAFSKTSPDGKWLIEETNGFVNIHDGATGATYEYGDDFATYVVGLGNSVTNTGRLVGCLSNSKPGYWDAATQTWAELPTKESDVLYGSLANSITPDGKFICGSMATGDFMGNESTLNLVPVVWTLQDDGSYGMYEVLPHPEVDFLGKVPQYATAIAISDDGQTAIGQLVDNSGFYTLTLLYRKDAEGKWSYSIPHPELIYDAEAVAALPEPPGATPKYPDAAEYMDDAAREAYQAAIDAYYQAIDDYYNGVTDEFPDYPNQSDFLDEAGKAAYEAAIDLYNKEINEYWDEYAKYTELLDAAVTGYSYNWNSVSLSGNGKFAATELTMRSTTGWGVGKVVPVRMDITAEGADVLTLKGEDMITTSVTDKGTVLAAAPATEYTRSSFVFDDADAQPVTVMDYVARFDDEAADWMNENLRYNVIVYEYDPETYEETSTVVEDSLVTGTVRINAKGNVLSGFLYDMWSGTYMPLSYVADLGDAAGIHTVGLASKRPTVTVKGGRVLVDGNVRSVRLYNAEGRTVANTTGALAVPGCYVVRTEDAEGNVWTERIVVKTTK